VKVLRYKIATYFVVLSVLDSLTLFYDFFLRRVRVYYPRFSSFRERLQLPYYIPLESLVKHLTPRENDDLAFRISITLLRSISLLVPA